MKERKKQAVTLPMSLYNKLYVVASDQDMLVGELIRVLCREYLEDYVDDNKLDIDLDEIEDVTKQFEESEDEDDEDEESD